MLLLAHRLVGNGSRYPSNDIRRCVTLLKHSSFTARKDALGTLCMQFIEANALDLSDFYYRQINHLALFVNGSDYAK